jgi:hypothetical protein
MKFLIAAASAVILIAAAHAQGTPTCKAAAAEKKLAGAALKSFMTKCENDAKGACTMSAKEKKLAGAAEKSFTTKCVGDKVGK